MLDMKTPSEILEKFEQATVGLDYGTVALTLSVKQGRPRYVITREESFVPKEELSACKDFMVKEEPGKR